MLISLLLLLRCSRYCHFARMICHTISVLFSLSFVAVSLKPTKGLSGHLYTSQPLSTYRAHVWLERLNIGGIIFLIRSISTLYRPKYSAKQLCNLCLFRIKINSSCQHRMHGTKVYGCGYGCRCREKGRFGEQETKTKCKVWTAFVPFRWMHTHTHTRVSCMHLFKSNNQNRAIRVVAWQVLRRGTREHTHVRKFYACAAMPQNSYYSRLLNEIFLCWSTITIENIFL